MYARAQSDQIKLRENKTTKNKITRRRNDTSKQPTSREKSRENQIVGEICVQKSVTIPSIQSISQPFIGRLDWTAKMMNPPVISNSGSLEDCHTNFFQLVNKIRNAYIYFHLFVYLFPVLFHQRRVVTSIICICCGVELIFFSAFEFFFVCMRFVTVLWQ